MSDSFFISMLFLLAYLIFMLINLNALLDWAKTKGDAWLAAFIFAPVMFLLFFLRSFLYLLILEAREFVRLFKKD